MNLDNPDDCYSHDQVFHNDPNDLHVYDPNNLQIHDLNDLHVHYPNDLNVYDLHVYHPNDLHVHDPNDLNIHYDVQKALLFEDSREEVYNEIVHLCETSDNEFQDD
ncbi:13488_t:CDS:2, partial [Racocetra fulgida]